VPYADVKVEFRGHLGNANEDRNYFGARSMGIVTERSLDLLENEVLTAASTSFVYFLKPIGPYDY
jgi:hypothetical protein